MIKCPCDLCLVKPLCKNKLFREAKGHLYLIVSFAETCPFILEYFGIDPKTNKPKHDYSKIHKICDTFGASDKCGDYYFVWMAS